MHSTDTIHNLPEHPSGDYDRNLEVVAELDARDLEEADRARSELERAHWLGMFANPAGESTSAVFRRSQMTVWLARACALVFFAAASVVGSPGVGSMVLGVVLVLTFLSSIVQHIRRFADAGKPSWFGAVAAVPMLVLGGLGYSEASAFTGRMQQLMLAAEGMQNLQKAATSGSDGTDGAAPAAAPPAEPAMVNAGTRRPPPARGGNPMAGMGPNIPLIVGGWLMAMLGTALVTWLYAARLPSRVRRE